MWVLLRWLSGTSWVPEWTGWDGMALPDLEGWNLLLVCSQPPTRDEFVCHCEGSEDDKKTVFGQVPCSKSAWQKYIQEKEDRCMGPRWRWSKEACAGPCNGPLWFALAGETLCDPRCLHMGCEGAQRHSSKETLGRNWVSDVCSHHKIRVYGGSPCF